MRRSPPKLTIEDLSRPVLPQPNEHKTPAPAVVVACWCGLVERMDRQALDRFTRDIWRRFDEKDLAVLKQAMLARRRVPRIAVDGTAYTRVVNAGVATNRPGEARSMPRFVLYCAPLMTHWETNGRTVGAQSSLRRAP